MKHLICLIVLLATGCASTAPTLSYVQGDRDTFNSFAPVVQRDVAAGHADTQMAYTAWRIRLEAAEAATGATPAATQP